MTASLIARQKFCDSDLGKSLRIELVKMVGDPAYNTRPIYSRLQGGEFYFVDKHMSYMSRFPNMSHWQYVMNLKLMTKIRK